jgi:hypothetical protein
MGQAATEAAISNLEIVVGSADRRLSLQPSSHDGLLETVGLAQDAVAVRDRRLVGPWFAAVEVAHGRVASWPKLQALKPHVASVDAAGAVPERDIDGQPLPESQRTDDRFDCWPSSRVLKSLGCDGVLVLVDRVDGRISSPARSADAGPGVSMLDSNSQPGAWTETATARELADYMQRADRDFYQRAR